jgi:hypothetical protein
MNRYSVSSRLEEQLLRAMILAFDRGDRVAGHSLRDRLNALRLAAIMERQGMTR